MGVYRNKIDPGPVYTGGVTVIRVYVLTSALLMGMVAFSSAQTIVPVVTGEGVLGAPFQLDGQLFIFGSTKREDLLRFTGSGFNSVTLVDSSGRVRKAGGFGSLPLGSLDGHFFFAGTDRAESLPVDARDRGIWKFDGTNQVTFLAADALDFRDVGTFQGAMYLAARPPQADAGLLSELWRFDGQQLIAVGDLDPFGGSLPQNFCNFQDAMYFSAGLTRQGGTLWRYDGFDLQQVGWDLAGESSWPNNLTVFRNQLYFAAWADRGPELYRFDADTGTVELVADRNPGPGGTYPEDLIVFRDALYFDSGGADETRGLIRFNGEEFTRIAEMSMDGPMIYQDELYFSHCNVDMPQQWPLCGLYRYDGHEINAIYQEPYLPGDGFFVADMFVFADQLYFTGRTSPHGPGLFRVDMVPEPSSILILGIGFCGLFRRTQVH